MIHPSKFPNRVTIRHKTGGRDAAGQPIPGDWVDYVALWANIRFLSGLESIRGDAPASIARASIRIRYREDITSAMRAVHRGRVYEITAVLPDEARREHVDLTCTVVENPT